MDRALAERHLAVVERHVAAGEYYVACLSEIVAELTADGHEAKTALEALMRSEEILSRQSADYNRIRAELAAME
jgi:hypothetical protein